MRRDEEAVLDLRKEGGFSTQLGHLSLHSPQSGHFVLRDDLDVGGGEDADHGVALSLVPVGVHLAAHIDYVAFLEAQFTVILRLKMHKNVNNCSSLEIILQNSFWKRVNV